MRGGGETRSRPHISAPQARWKDSPAVRKPSGGSPDLTAAVSHGRGGGGGKRPAGWVSVPAVPCGTDWGGGGGGRHHTGASRGRQGQLAAGPRPRVTSPHRWALYHPWGLSGPLTLSPFGGTGSPLGRGPGNPAGIRTVTVFRPQSRPLHPQGLPQTLGAMVPGLDHPTSDPSRAEPCALPLCTPLPRDLPSATVGGAGTKVAEVWGGDGTPGHIAHHREKRRGHASVRDQQRQGRAHHARPPRTPRARAQPHLPGCGRTPKGSLPSARGPAQSHACQSPASGPPAAHRERGGGPRGQCPPHRPPAQVLAAPQGCRGVRAPGVPAVPAPFPQCEFVCTAAL